MTVKQILAIALAVVVLGIFIGMAIIRPLFRSDSQSKEAMAYYGQNLYHYEKP